MTRFRAASVLDCPNQKTSAPQLTKHELISRVLPTHISPNILQQRGHVFQLGRLPMASRWLPSKYHPKSTTQCNQWKPFMVKPRGKKPGSTGQGSPSPQRCRASIARSMKVFSPSPPMAEAARDFSGPAEMVFTRMPYLSWVTR